MLQLHAMKPRIGLLFAFLCFTTGRCLFAGAPLSPGIPVEVQARAEASPLRSWFLPAEKKDIHSDDGVYCCLGFQRNFWHGWARANGSIKSDIQSPPGVVVEHK